MNKNIDKINKMIGKIYKCLSKIERRCEKRGISLSPLRQALLNVQVELRNISSAFNAE